ncbi:hypothetical protein N4P33_13225, partial [Streptomyces sp. 15-116A]|nr:hypothetical protein [Streptomyces sp. 15-116A]
MTAENTGNTGNTENSGNTEYDGMDALMAAILDEPLPAEAERDPAFMTAHGEAAADIALLREQLTLIGDALAGPARQTEREAETAEAAPGAEAATGTETGAPAGRDKAAPTGTRPEPGTGPEPGA